MQAIKQYAEHTDNEVYTDFSAKERDAFQRHLVELKATFERNLRDSYVSYTQEQTKERGKQQRYQANRATVVAEGERWEQTRAEPALEVSTFGQIRYHKTKRSVPLKFDQKGRLMIAGAIGRNLLLHRLVADQFIPNPHHETYKYVNFIDGNKRHTALYNLERVDSKGNVYKFDEYIAKTYADRYERPLEYDTEKWRNYDAPVRVIRELIKYGLEPGDEALLEGMKERQKRNAELDAIAAKNAAEKSKK